MIKFGNDIIKVNNSWLTTGEPTPPGPVFPYRTVRMKSTKYSDDFMIFAENFHEDDGEGGVYIIDNVIANGVNYGTQYYYTQEAAIRIANKFSAEYEGWHLPSQAEFADIWFIAAELSPDPYFPWSDVFNYMASTSGWDNNLNGLNTFGFNAEPVGTVLYASNTVYPVNPPILMYYGSVVGYWNTQTSTSPTSQNLSWCSLYQPEWDTSTSPSKQSSGLILFRSPSGPNNYAYSVRLVKDLSTN